MRGGTQKPEYLIEFFRKHLAIARELFLNDSNLAMNIRNLISHPANGCAKFPDLLAMPLVTRL
jgi:hypothetical protein